MFSDARCPDGFYFIQKQQSCYALMRDVMNYTDAQLHCGALHEDSTLVTIETDDELHCVASWADSSTSTFVGIPRQVQVYVRAWILATADVQQTLFSEIECSIKDLKCCCVPTNISVSDVALLLSELYY